VGRIATPDLLCGEAVLHGRIIVSAVLVSWTGGQPRAHAALDFRIEREAEAFVDALHLVQWLTLEGAEIDVDETLRMTLTHLLAALHRPGPEITLARTDGRWIDLPCVEEAARRPDHSAHRRDALNRIAMRLDDAGVGKDLEQRIEMRQGAGILQQPALLRSVGADQTQVVGIAAVTGALILPVQPAIVVRQPE